MCVSTIAEGFFELLKNARRATQHAWASPSSGAAVSRCPSPTMVLASTDPGVLLRSLHAGRPVDAGTGRTATTCAFGASDAEGAWVRKDAYKAGVVLFVRRCGCAMCRQAAAREEYSRRMPTMLDAVAAPEPSHTKRSEDEVCLQQFSTPLPLDYAAFRAAAVGPGVVGLEPSAGTGMLAVMAQCALGSRAARHLHVNGIADVRAGLLDTLFCGGGG